MEYDIMAVTRRLGNLPDSLLIALKILSDLVSRRIAEGWEPIGGVTIDSEIVCQAIIRRPPF